MIKSRIKCMCAQVRRSDGLVVTYAKIVSNGEISKHNEKKACAGWNRGQCQDVVSRDMASACLLP
jgi:hypothetical protein